MATGTKAHDVITGMMKEDIDKNRIEVQNLRADCKSVVEQHEQGLVTAEEMGNKLILNGHEILTRCKRIGGWFL